MRYTANIRKYWTIVHFMLREPMWLAGEAAEDVPHQPVLSAH